MHTLLQDLRFALRQLRRAPGFALAVVATLSLGVGLNAAIFSVVDNVLLRPLGYHDADRIVAIQTHFVDESRSIPRLGGDDFNDLANNVHGFEATANYSNYSDGLELQGSSFYVPIAQVSARFMEIMGVQPLAGRLFHSADQNGTDVLLSAAFSRLHFSSPQAAIGKPITYNGQLHTIVGVLPEGFSFPDKTEVWFEGPARPANANRSAYNSQAIAKRRATTTQAQLDAELTTFSANERREFPEDSNKSFEAVSLQERIVGPVRPTLRLLMGAVAVVLLIVFANVAHLLLVHGTRQLRAVTICTALGASRLALIRRALAETILLAVAGSLVALALAGVSLRLLIRLAPPDIPRLADVRLNFDVFLFSIAVALAVMVLAALLPVWHSWHVDPTLALRNKATRNTESRSAVRLRNGFLVGQIALTLTLSVSAVLLTRQLIAQAHQDLGFSPDALLILDAHAVLTTATPVPSDPNDQSPRALAAIRKADSDFEHAKLNHLDQTLASIASVPGVQAVAAISGAPMLDAGSNGLYAIKGRQTFDVNAGKLPWAEFNVITPGLPFAVGMSLVRGRSLSANDRFGAPQVVLIDAALARQQFPNQDPINQQIQCGYDRESSASWATIVGVVSDIRSNSPATPPKPTLYLAVAQHPNPASDMQFVVRTQLDPTGLAQTLITHLHRAFPETAIKAWTMREAVGETERADQFRTTLFTGFAAVSLLLAAIGMYGVTAYTVAQRRFEFGLRAALGANRTQLLSRVLRGGLGVALLGVACGTVLSLSLQQVLGSVAGKLPVFDGVAYSIAALCVLLIAFVANLIPAGRAARVDPMTVLRGE